MREGCALFGSAAVQEASGDRAFLANDLRSMPAHIVQRT